MKAARILYLVGTISFGVMCGIGHLIFEFFGEKSNVITQTMEGLVVSMPGRETNMLLLDTGLSLVMGLMLFAYGVINLMIILDGKRINLPSRKIMIANIVFSLAAFLLVTKYLFSIPVIFTFIAFLSFGTAFFLRLKNTE